MHRSFKERPPAAFVQKVQRHVKETGTPETMPELFRGKIPDTAKFMIMCRIDIDSRKRSRSERADCPMCAPNRFLSGRLCWFYELGYCAVIGHLCADSENNDEAEKAYEIEESRGIERDYLFETIPKLDYIRGILREFRPTALEAERLYKKFRKEAKNVRIALRSGLNEQGRLSLVEVKQLDSETDGPAGMGRSQYESRALFFGTLEGATILQNVFRPVSQIDDALQVIEDCALPTSESDLLDQLFLIDDVTRVELYSAIHRIANFTLPQLEFSLRDFPRFFTPKNAERIKAWANHPANESQIQIETITQKGDTIFEFTGPSEVSRLLPRSELFQIYDVDPHPK